MKTTSIVIWVLRVIAAVILLQTLFFKFTGAPESISMFETLGAEPFGRYGSGIFELIAAVLLVIPKYTWAGALLGMGIMVGAIASHLFVLGIDVQGDGGLLFGLGVVVFLCCAILAWLHKGQIPFLKS